MTEKVWSISFVTYMYDNVMCLKKLNLVALDRDVTLIMQNNVTW